MEQGAGKGYGIRIAGVLALILIFAGLTAIIYMVTMPIEKREGVVSDTGANAALVAAGCRLDNKLVNSCRPWIGATANSYPDVKGWEQQLLYFEKRAGRLTDVAHSYHSPTQSSLNKSELKFLNRGTQLYANWKPDTLWRNADGRNASVNARIDQMARSIKAIGPKKIFLTLYHEPENDLSVKGSSCSRHVGNKGTAAEYRAMWKNVRQRFDSLGVTNVVWVMNYMGWSGWDCAVKALWPGNNLVDWITWDPYTNDKSDFYKDMSRFYTFLTENSDKTHDFMAKPWGIAEMGYEGGDQKKAYRYYDDMAAVILNQRLPKLKMYLMFDMNGRDFGGDPKWDARIGYSRSGTIDKAEQQRFNAMFSRVAALNQPAPSSDLVAPAIMVTSPQKSPITAKGVVTFSAKASDNMKVSAVTIRVDDKWIATDTVAPYAFALDTKKFTNGQHTVIMRAWDGNQNKSDAKSIVMKVSN